MFTKLKDHQKGGELDLATADTIAHEMKEWAIEKERTLYYTLVQPLTGATAEKARFFLSQHRCRTAKY